MTTVDIVKRALNICDCSNTDFLTHEELTHYLNEAMHFVCTQIVNHNVDVFTNQARLVGANGVYRLPFDFWQMKTIENPQSGQQILRKTASFPKNSSGYELVGDSIVISGINPGPVVVTYYRKPFYLSIPNKTLEDIDVGTILDTSENNILYTDNDYLYIWTSKGIVNVNFSYEEGRHYFLIKDEYVVKVWREGIEATQEDPMPKFIDHIQMLDLEGNEIWTDTKIPDYFIKSNDGLVYFGYEEEENVVVNKLGTKVYTTDGLLEDNNTLICIDGEFYEVPMNSFPIGKFDDRPAYTYDGKLYLINPNGSTIEEPLDLPIMKIDGQIKYGILSNHKLYSNIPNTDLNFPNYVLYDLIAFRLAVYFLCKMNAESSGVESQYTAMEKQFYDTLDASAGYQRLVNVR